MVYSYLKVLLFAVTVWPMTPQSAVSKVGSKLLSKCVLVLTGLNCFFKVSNFKIILKQALGF